jgi:hypothetical protein
MIATAQIENDTAENHSDIQTLWAPSSSNIPTMHWGAATRTTAVKQKPKQTNHKPASEVIWLTDARSVQYATATDAAIVGVTLGIALGIAVSNNVGIKVGMIDAA